MERDGYINRDYVRSGPGRPSLQYQITPEGNRLFPSYESELNLITNTPDEGFHVAVQLARKGVTTTQPDKEVLIMLRDVYVKVPDALIASSQIITIHFQTVAAANNYWRDGNPDE